MLEINLRKVFLRERTRANDDRAIRRIVGYKDVSESRAGDLVEVKLEFARSMEFHFGCSHLPNNRAIRPPVGGQVNRGRSRRVADENNNAPNQWMEPRSNRSSSRKRQQWHRFAQPRMVRRMVLPLTASSRFV